MRPLEEQTVLVTGSTDGLGKGVATELAARGATVLLHGRDNARLDATAEAIHEETGSQRIACYRADLSSLCDVRLLAENVADTEQSIDVLVNNAGIVAGSQRELSRDGYELTFVVNHLSHFLLTVLLLPLLRTETPARIVNVASGAQSAIDFDDVMLDHGYDPLRAYGQSKLAQIMFIFELAERLERQGYDGVSVNALHPATFMDTKMVRESFGTPTSSVAEGVEATMRLIASRRVRGASGRYYSGKREAGTHPQAGDEDACHRLWSLSSELSAAAVATQ